MTTDTITEESQTSGELFGHPKGLYICFATELWERFSFYGMKYLLLLYLTKYHLFSDGEGLDILGSYAGLVYALPVIGGLLADRYLGMRKAVVFGGILLVLGHLGMAFEGHQAVQYDAGTVLKESLTLASGEVLQAGTLLSETVKIQDTAALKVFYFSLALIIIGVGYLKPNISTIVGKLYPDNDPRKDSGFTIFYMGINLGSFLATMICTWLGETYGWGYGFGAAGIGMVFGLITFIWGQKYLDGHAEPSNPSVLKEKLLGIITKEHFIYLCSFLALFIVWKLVQKEPWVHMLQNSMLAVTLIGLLVFSILKGSKDELYRMLVLMVLIVSSIIFWALFEQSAGSMTFYADRVVDRVLVDMVVTADSATNFYLVGALLFALAFGLVFWLKGKVARSSFNYEEKIICYAGLIGLWCLVATFAMMSTLKGVEYGRLDASETGKFFISFAAGQFGSLNALFIILLAPVFAYVWVFLSKRSLEPNTPIKFGLGILQAGLGFGMLVYGATHPSDAGKVSMIWLVLAYLLHTTGELCLSPVGLSAVTKLSIPRVVGLSMGTWFLATALSETVATRIGKMAAIDSSGGSESATVAEQLATYTELYSFLMWLGIGAGLAMILISPLLKKGMRGVH